ncbi:TetR/AcrR family transcriptional regulator [Saccharothrix violaceirubra]|uniref:DNA-binding transcriptional regulator YbjK n=1 Tax=Saccharothrix violaceirubra TaxID=413306 RepID=A0A7W7WXU2_9PSEU|nr:TetR family transcriptional regulator [Saccharothrix violaceirubra]MBB4967804.1 DNA-binding transcriptional regulator YbjK [Saccharothrix violaceirubra]
MTDRRTLLADAAIHVIAARGMRGLTHRAVDAEAGVPEGSTSAYFRTRKALVEAVVHRLSELDQVEMADVLTAEFDLDRFALLVATVLDGWLGPARTRTLARYACLLEATHHEELRGILAHGEKPRAQTVAILRAAGVPSPEAAGHTLVAFLEGLLFDRLVGAGATTSPPPGTPESVASLTKAVRMGLRAVVEG